jgi:hypothetical protein
MTRHQLPAALYAPLRVVLYEDGNGRGIFEYVRRRAGDRGWTLSR